MARTLPIEMPNGAEPVVLDDAAELAAVLETVRNENAPEHLLEAARTLQSALDQHARRRLPN